MTRSSTIRRLGWLAAVLAVGVISLNAEAGQRQRGQKKSGQERRHVEKRQTHKRQRAAQQRQREARNYKQAERRRDVQRGRDRQHDARQQRALRTERHDRVRRESSAHVRGANWGVNAQRKKLGERQAKVRQQERRLEHVRVENRRDLRDAKRRFDHKVDRTRQDLRRRDHRLDHKAAAIHKDRRTSHRKPGHHVTRHQYKPRPVAKHKPHHGHGYRYGHRRPGHGVYRHDRHDKHRDRFGFYISFGNSGYFHYEYGHRRHYCCTGGYYIWDWVPPLTVVRYDDYDEPYTVVIRAGYHKRVWVPHYCRYGRHHYKRY